MMPTLARAFVRTALAFLALGGTAGGVLLIHKASGIHPGLWTLLPIHLEWLLVGFCLQLALGVAWWIFPRLADNTRGRVPLAWAAFALLNAGLLTHAAVFVTQATTEAVPAWGHLPPVALQALAVALYAVAIWPRVGFVPEEIQRHRARR